MAHGSGEDDVHVRFGAEIDELKDKLGQVSGLFKEVMEHFEALTAVVAGGEAFKEFVEVANEAAVQSEKVSRTLGITASQAQVLRIALDDVSAQLGDSRVNADMYTDAFVKFNRQLRSNSDALKTYGVDVDGVRNGTVSSTQAFQQAIDAVAKYKPGIDQTQASMELFGRSVDDVHALMRLTPELMEESRKHAEALGLTLSDTDVKAAAEYRSAMNNLHDVLEGVSKTIGSEVMPMLSESADAMSQFGPAIVEGAREAAEAFVLAWQQAREAVKGIVGEIREIFGLLNESLKALFGEGTSAGEVFKATLQDVVALFIGLRIAVELAVNTISTLLTATGAVLVAFGHTAERAFHLDWTGAKAAWQQGTADLNRILDEGVQKAFDIANKGQQDITKVMTSTMGRPDSKGAGSSAIGGTGVAIDTQRLDGLLQARNALLKSNNDAALALQLEYLKEDQAALDDSFKQHLVSIKQYYDAKQAIETEAIDASIAAKKRELDQTASAAGGAIKEEDKLKFQAQEAKLAGEINVLEARRNEIVRQNGQAYAEAEQQLQDQLGLIRATEAKANADSDIAVEKGAIEQRKALRQVDAEEAFQEQRALEQRDYDATMQLLAAKRAQIHGDDQVALAQQQADEQAAEREHQAKLTEIDRAATLERAKLQLQADQQVESGFSTLIADLLSGHKRLRDAVLEFGQVIAHTFQQLIAQKFAEKLFGSGSAGGALIDKLTAPFLKAIEMIVGKWLGGEATITAAKATEATTREGIATAEAATNATATTTTIAAQQAASVAAVMGWSAAAAVAAMASVAAIPFYGWAMAPEVGAETYAMGMGYLASAEGGWWQIPGDQVAQVHKNEMVLPAEHAANLRALLGGGVQALGGGKGDNHFHISPVIQALDGHSVKRVLVDNPEALAKGIQNAMRLGHGRGIG